MRHINGLCEQSTVILNVAAPDARTYNAVVNGLNIVGKMSDLLNTQL